MACGIKVTAKVKSGPDPKEVSARGGSERCMQGADAAAGSRGEPSDIFSSARGHGTRVVLD